MKCGIVEQRVAALEGVSVAVEHVVAQLAVGGARGLDRVGYLCLHLAYLRAEGDGRIEVAVTAALRLYQLPTVIIVEVHMLVAQACPNLPDFGQHDRILGIRADALLFQRAVGGGDVVLRIHVVVLSPGVDILGPEVERAAKQGIGQGQFRGHHPVPDAVLGIKPAVVLYLTCLYDPALVVIAAAQIVEVEVNVQFPDFADVVCIQFMACTAFRTLVGLIVPSVVELAVSRHVACQGCDVFSSGRERIFVFGTKHVVFIERIVEAALDAVVTTYVIHMHIQRMYMLTLMLILMTSRKQV